MFVTGDLGAVQVLARSAVWVGPPDRLYWSVTVGAMAVTVPAESVKPQRAAQPLTERILPRGRLRWLVIVLWSSVPFVRLAIFASLIAGAGLVSAPAVVVQE